MVRRLTLEDAGRFQALRREALDREPFAFGSSLEDDRFRSADLVREMLLDAEQAVFGAFDPDLVGMAGVLRLNRRKLRHKAQLWGVYVRAEHRGRNLGRALVEAAIRFARDQDGVRLLHLTVTERATAAAALYAKLGFVVWGVEPGGLCIDDVEVAERHMVLRLQERP
jgi:ribosomal protein S18 acetylase RimI-like enzyme